MEKSNPQIEVQEQKSFRGVKNLTLAAEMPKGNLGLVADHSTLQSPKNIAPLVEQSISGTVDEEFVVLNYQPTITVDFFFQTIK